MMKHQYPTFLQFKQLNTFRFMSSSNLGTFAYGRSLRPWRMSQNYCYVANWNDVSQWRTSFWCEAKEVNDSNAPVYTSNPSSKKAKSTPIVHFHKSKSFPHYLSLQTVQSPKCSFTSRTYTTTNFIPNKEEQSSKNKKVPVPNLDELKKNSPSKMDEQSNKPQQKLNMTDIQDFYSFSAKRNNGTETSMSEYKGNVVLVVNTASQCGLTKTNYTQLQELQDKYYDQGLRILAFPCNQFAGQEPGTDQDIEKFVCEGPYKGTFELFSKVDVNGKNAHPLWAWLKTQKSGFLTNAIKWNFTKFLIDKNGVPHKRYSPTDSPFSLEGDIKMLLEQN